MKIAVLDLEMNCPQSEWDKQAKDRAQWAPIIEIGAVIIDIRAGRVVSKFKKYINPHEPIFPGITELTGITDEDVTQTEALDLAEGLDLFWRWMENNQCKFLAAWGRDHEEVLEESKRLKISPVKPMRTLDIKSMFEVLKAGLPNRRIKGGLKATLETFDLEFSGTPHRASIDALNTAKLLFLAKEMIYFVDIMTNHDFKKLQE